MPDFFIRFCRNPEAIHVLCLHPAHCRELQLSGYDILSNIRRKKAVGSLLCLKVEILTIPGPAGNMISVRHPTNSRVTCFGRLERTAFLFPPRSAYGRSSPRTLSWFLRAIPDAQENSRQYYFHRQHVFKHRYYKPLCRLPSRRGSPHDEMPFVDKFRILRVSHRCDQRSWSSTEFLGDKRPVKNSRQTEEMDDFEQFKAYVDKDPFDAIFGHRILGREDPTNISPPNRCRISRKVAKNDNLSKQTDIGSTPSQQSQRVGNPVPEQSCLDGFDFDPVSIRKVPKRDSSKANVERQDESILASIECDDSTDIPVKLYKPKQASDKLDSSAANKYAQFAQIGPERAVKAKLKPLDAAVPSASTSSLKDTSTSATAMKDKECKPSASREPNLSRASSLEDDAPLFSGTTYAAKAINLTRGLQKPNHAEQQCEAYNGQAQTTRSDSRTKKYSERGVPKTNSPARLEPSLDRITSSPPIMHQTFRSVDHQTQSSTHADESRLINEQSSKAGTNYFGIHNDQKTASCNLQRLPTNAAIASQSQALLAEQEESLARTRALREGTAKLKETAMRDKESELSLARALKSIYEDEYGSIDQEHRQVATASSPKLEVARKLAPASSGSETRQSSDSTGSLPSSSFSSSPRSEGLTKSVLSAASSPTVYKVLAYDSSTLQITIAETTSSSSAASTATVSPSRNTTPEGEKHIPMHPTEILSRLNNVAKFLPYFADMERNGYEMVSGSGDVLVFKKVRTARDLQIPKSEIIPQITAASPMSSSSPSFPASPSTSFQDRPAVSSVNPTTSSPASASPSLQQSDASFNPRVQRQEPVFSGSSQPWHHEIESNNSTASSNATSASDSHATRSDFSEGRDRAGTAKRILTTASLAAVMAYGAGVVMDQ